MTDPKIYYYEAGNPESKAAAAERAAKRTRLGRIWQRLLARFRLSEAAICEQSVGMGVADYHDYPDSTVGQPFHFYKHVCKRCGKSFSI